jgi:SOS-response transcriptional repressor LexA
MKTRTRHATKPGEPPTDRQLALYRLVLKFFAEHGHAPTAAEVAALDGGATPTAVIYQLQALGKKGWLDLATEGRGRGVMVPRLLSETKVLARAMEKAARDMKTVPRKNGKPIRPGEPPTPLQGRMYRLLLKFFATHGYPPTLREMVEVAGASSTALVVAHLSGLHKRGLVVVKKHNAKDAKGPKGAIVAKPVKPAKGAAKPRRQARNIEVPKLRDATKALAAKLLAEME